MIEMAATISSLRTSSRWANKKCQKVKQQLRLQTVLQRKQRRKLHLFIVRWSSVRLASPCTVRVSLIIAFSLSSVFCPRRPTRRRSRRCKRRLIRGSCSWRLGRKHPSWISSKMRIRAQMRQRAWILVIKSGKAAGGQTDDQEAFDSIRASQGSILDRRFRILHRSWLVVWARTNSVRTLTR